MGFVDPDSADFCGLGEPVDIRTYPQYDVLRLQMAYAISEHGLADTVLLMTPKGRVVESLDPVEVSRRFFADEPHRATILLSHMISAILWMEGVHGVERPSSLDRVRSGDKDGPASASFGADGDE